MSSTRQSVGSGRSIASRASAWSWAAARAKRVAAILAIAAPCTGACGPPPVAPTPPGAPATSPSGEAATPAQSRVFQDLGAAHLVPQLGTDSDARFAVSPDGLLGLVGAGFTDLAVQVWDLDRRLVVAELVPPSPASYRQLGFAHGAAFIVLQAPNRAVLWDGVTGALLGDLDLGPGPSVVDYEREDPTALVYDTKARSVVLRAVRGGAELFRVRSKEPLALFVAGDRYWIVTDESVEVRDREGKLVAQRPRDRQKDERPENAAAWAPPEAIKPPADLGLDDVTRCADGGAPSGRRLLCSSFNEGFHVVHLDAKPPLVEALAGRLHPRFDVVDAGAGVRVECTPAQHGVFGFPRGSKARADAERVASLRATARQRDATARFIEASGAEIAIGNGLVVAWDIASGAERFRIADPDVSSSSEAAVSPDGSRVAVGGEDAAGRVSVYDLPTGSLIKTMQHGHFLRRILWNADGTVLATAARIRVGPYYLSDPDASVKLWSVAKGKVLRTFRGAYDAAYSARDAAFAVWSYELAELYDTRGLKRIAHVTGPGVYAVPSADGRWFVSPVVDTSASHPGLYRDTALRLHDARTGAVVRTLDGSGPFAWSAVGPRLLATGDGGFADEGGRDVELLLFSVSGGKSPERRWPGIAMVTSPAFVAGDALVASTLRSMVRLSRVGDGASLWIEPVVVAGSCEAIAFDDAGDFDGGGTSAVAFRLGDDLRRSAVVREGPRVDALRSPRLYADFVAHATGASP
jgi:hypothetical protein